MDFENDFLSEQAYADLTRRNIRSVQRERALRAGPAYIRIGRRIFYRRTAVEAWLIAQEQAQPRAAGVRK